VNVGGHHTIRTPDLLALFETAGFSEVSAFRASGNVRFRAGRFERGTVERTLAQALSEHLGGTVDVFVRTMEEVGTIAAEDPWRRPPANGEAPYISFLARTPSERPLLPQSTPRGDVEVLAHSALEVYAWGRQVGSLPGFPNAFVERIYGVPATTRNRSTLLALADGARRIASHP
jgi:uncharacterized protein (DUF1697 family)